ncbi:MAG: glutathione S-transferase family protein [Rhodospirillaceae bacterium]|jgi:glutathione S-transferase|nr:glutathione S-transferase family protein [Rhodospirillaceae bacterium]
MTQPTLIIGNRNYSSWSLRAWLMLKMTGQPFEEIQIALDETNTKQEILRYSPSGRVPVMIWDELSVWDSLAIGEYLAERLPGARLWPEDPTARSIARSVSSEMHSGFTALREHMPMNIRGSFPGIGREQGVQEDINRIAAIWRRCRKRFGTSVDEGFLFGHFSIADAMFAPVATRFTTFAVELGEEEQDYVDRILGLPAMRDWVTAAENEPMIIESAEF